MTTIFEIDLTPVTEPETYTLTLSPQICKETALRFKIPHLYTIDINMNLTPQKHSWLLAGHVASTVQLRCVQSNDLFDESFKIPFEVVLSQYEIEDDTLDVEILEVLKVDAGDIALQYLALQIPLHPIHPNLASDVSLAQTDTKEISSSSWKEALADLKQQK
jgi:hypothetical protein